MNKLVNIIILLILLSSVTYAQDTFELCVRYDQDGCSENDFMLYFTKKSQIKVEDDSLFRSLFTCNQHLYSLGVDYYSKLDLPEKFHCGSYLSKFVGRFACSADSVEEMIKSNIILPAFLLDTVQSVGCSGINEISQYYGKKIKGVSVISVDRFHYKNHSTTLLSGMDIEFKTRGDEYRILEHEFEAVIVGECK